MKNCCVQSKSAIHSFSFSFSITWNRKTTFAIAAKWAPFIVLNARFAPRRVTWIIQCRLVPLSEPLIKRRLSSLECDVTSVAKILEKFSFLFVYRCCKIRVLFMYPTHIYLASEAWIETRWYIFLNGSALFLSHIEFFAMLETNIFGTPLYFWRFIVLQNSNYGSISSLLLFFWGVGMLPWGFRKFI